MNRHDIIVIGASAGGVQAVTDLVSRLPADLPASLFVVVHISPLSKSQLPEILSSKGPLPAVHISDGMPFKRGRIYVARPDYHMMVQDGVVRLDRGPRQNMARPAIDALFESAAREHGARVVGIVLSGQLDDGTAGLAHVKEAGGIAIVQDPEEAEHSGMPRSAIENVEVDYVVPIAKIPPLLVSLAGKGTKDGNTPSPAGKPAKGNDRSKPGKGGNMFPPAGSKEGNHPGSESETRPQQSPDGTLPAASDMERSALAAGDLDPPNALICPECGGAMRELPEGNFVRFRCHVGHIFSPETLRDQKNEEIEDTLWAAIRVLKESAALASRLAVKSLRLGMRKAAAAYEKEATEALQHAEVLQTLIEKEVRPSRVA